MRVREEVEALGPSPLVLSADRGDRAQIPKLVAELQLRLGRVDALINNAAISLRRSVEQSLERADDFARLVEVNYLGPVALTLGLLGAMLERGRGHIVNVSTIGVQTGAPNFAAYVASKAAMDHFARALALELGRRRISVTTVYMPLVRTPMLDRSRIYAAWPALQADKAARRIGRALIRGPVRVAPRWTSGVELLHTLAPGLMRAAFARLHDPVHRWMDQYRPADQGRQRPPESTH
jgi:NAD(P)-dependent dehydrogenase (short-subunit alcohol dehydrogenase family)